METRGIAEGMVVRASDGKKLGTVIECGPDQFLVEKGTFFPKDYAVGYQEVEGVADGEVRLRIASDDLSRARETTAGEQGRATSAAAGSTARADRLPPQDTSEEVRVPLASEEVEPVKHERQAGEVRVKKDVVTEQKQVSVPVTREEVFVERTPVEGSPPAGEAAFEETSVSVPVREEEVEIRKRPVVREEVRVGKTQRREERRADADVRREEARVEREPGTPERDPDEQ